MDFDGSIYRAVACGGGGRGGAVAPQNFQNFVKFLGKMAARRKFCIVGENLAPQTKSPGYGPDLIISLRTLLRRNGGKGVHSV